MFIIDFLLNLAVQLHILKVTKLMDKHAALTHILHSRHLLKMFFHLLILGSESAYICQKLGDEVKGMKELMGVARRAPASIDMRAALAALYWSQVWQSSNFFDFFMLFLS